MPITKASSNAVAAAAKGDLVVGNATNDSGVLAVGSAAQVLTVDSSTATGLKWATPGGGGSSWSLLNTGGTALTGATTITVSGISGVDKIQVIIDGASAVNQNFEARIRFNANSSSVYRRGGGYITATATVGSLVSTSYGLDTEFVLGTSPITSTTVAIGGGVYITGANSSGFKSYSSVGAGGSAGTSGQTMNIQQGIFESTATISSVSIISNNGNFDAGTIYVFTSVS